MHFKYSTMLNITFVTMMYGFGIPMLFPLAAVSLTILYLVEKTMLYYSYRKPPMYDEKLGDTVLSIMSWAPLYYFAFGYWMVSSNQILSNDHLGGMIQLSTDVSLTGHTYIDAFRPQGWSTPGFVMLAMFWFFVAITIFGSVIFEKLSKCFTCLISGDIDKKEDLKKNYFLSLEAKQRKWSVEEERNLNNLGA